MPGPPSRVITVRMVAGSLGIRPYVVGGPDSSAMATEILALCTSKPRYRRVRCWCIMVIGPTSTYVALRRTSFVPPAQPTVTACAGPSILTSRGAPPHDGPAAQIEKREAPPRTELLT